MSALTSITGSLGGANGTVSIGNDAGWVLAFHAEKAGVIVPKAALVLSRDDYYAEIDATLPDGLGGGSYTFTIEGVTDEHYAQLKGKTPSDAPSVVRLYLSWRDTAAGMLGAIGDLLGGSLLGGTGGSPEPPTETMVAELSVIKVSRRVGQRRYEAVITAQERVFGRLQYYFTAQLKSPTYEQAVKDIGDGAGVPIELSGAGLLQKPTGDGAGTEAFKAAPNTARVEAVRQLMKALEDASGLRGRGMAVIRNGTLYIGPRAAPTAGELKNLDVGGGLIEAEALDPVVKDPAFDTQGGTRTPPTRKQYRLTLKGRPDIKPGDVVTFVPSPEEDGKVEPPSVLGALLGPVADLIGSAADKVEPTAFYVTSVRHRLGRTSGFVSTVTALEVQDNAWDVRKAVDVGDEPHGAHADPTAEVAHAIRKHAARAVDGVAQAEVAEVRAVHNTGGSAVEPPSQTTTVWRGLVGGDGRAAQARRLDVERAAPDAVDGVAYASPFAFGKCGLVLPRYPGTRVVLMHRGGETADPIDVGALWQSGHGPASEPGDWWLSLPVDWKGSATSLGEKDEPAEHAGAVSQDLIDGKGNRVVEVAGLTIRVGKATLKNAGTRPGAADEDTITIENTKAGSSIVMKPDGSIVIKAKSVEFQVADAVNVK